MNLMNILDIVLNNFRNNSSINIYSPESGFLETNRAPPTARWRYYTYGKTQTKKYFMYTRHE